jgi:hypothetical protein
MRPVRRLKWASNEQRLFFEAGPNPTLIIGGYNAAKTWGGILKLLRLLDLFPNSRAAIVRSNFRHMKKTTMETFYSLCPPTAYSQGRRSDQEGILQLNNGSLVYFIHLDKPDSIDVLAGLELNFGFVDQAEQISEKAWDTLDARLGRWAHADIPESVFKDYPEGWPWMNDEGESVPPPFLFATANPPESDDHFLFTRFAEESPDRARWAEEGYRYIRADSRTNRFASKANLTKLLSKDPEFVRRFVEGRWSNPEGSIFDLSPMSLLEPHPALLKHIINHMNLHRSLDHGDSNPTCVLWEATDDDGNIFVFREHYEVSLVSESRIAVYEKSKFDIPDRSPFVKPRYRSNIADPSIFGVSRGRSATSAPTWSIADEWIDVKVMNRETMVYWQPAPIPKSEGMVYELVTRSRMKEYLKPDPTHRHPISGELGAPRIYFIKKTADYPEGCDHVIKEIRGQRRVKIGERDGRSVYSQERDPNIVDHAYDTIKYHVISRPAPSRLLKKSDPNVINILDLMNWTARNMRRRASGRSRSY